MILLLLLIIKIHKNAWFFIHPFEPLFILRSIVPNIHQWTVPNGKQRPNLTFQIYTLRCTSKPGGSSLAPYHEWISDTPSSKLLPSKHQLVPTTRLLTIFGGTIIRGCHTIKHGRSGGGRIWLLVSVWSQVGWVPGRLPKWKDIMCKKYTTISCTKAECRYNVLLEILEDGIKRLLYYI